MTTPAPISFIRPSIRLQIAKERSSTWQVLGARRKADAKYPTFDMEQFQLALLCWEHKG
jgi:hypothetical protein